jgi:transposase
MGHSLQGRPSGKSSHVRGDAGSGSQFRALPATLRQCRRVATQYDKLAANYLAFIKLASIRIWLRTNEPTP